MPSTPLALKNLTAEPRRLILASAGIGFAVVLMFMQNGFRNALLDSPVQLLHVLRGDLIALSVARYSLPSEQAFPRELLYRAAADPDIVQIVPLYIERSRAHVRVVGEPRRPIRVVGVPIERGIFRDAEIDRQIELLAPPGTALLDRRTRRSFGFALHDPRRLATQPIELLDRSLRIVGTVEIGTDFAHEGTLIISRDSFAEYFAFRGDGDPLSQVDLGLIRIRPGADPEQVARRLTAIDPRWWQVLPRQKLIAREIQFWNTQTPIGMIFLVGALMGFAVGVIICYQVLFTNIHDSLPEFATLRAMGYPNRYFMGLVVRQSFYLSVIGYVPAIAVSWGLFQVLQSLAGLPMLLTWERAGMVFVLTVLMCLVSGFLALRKLLRADPASLF